MTISKLPPGTLAPDPQVNPLPGETTTPIGYPPKPGVLPPSNSSPPPTGGTTPATGTTDTGAKGILQAALDAYGLGSLADWAWQKFQAGESVDTILNFDLPQTTEFKTQFPEYDVLAKRGQALSPGQIIQYRTSIGQLAQQFGIPSDVNLKQLTSDWLLGNVSPGEAQARFSAAQTDILTAPPEKLNEIQRLYGLSSGELLAAYIAPDESLPLLQRKAQAAALGVRSETAGYGQLGAGTLEGLVNQGISEAQATQGFGHLASEKELFQALDSGESQIGQVVQLGAEFGGNAADAAQIAQRAQRRKAEFSGGGGYATGRSSSGAGNVGI
jgi:hypothetical protein